MNIYFIRHAPTEANLSGSMLKNYDDTSIIKPTREDIEAWGDKVGRLAPLGVGPVFTSPALRARQTVEAFFSSETKYEICDLLSEFDCHSLGDKKFWEITKEEFEELVPGVTSETMGYQAGKLDTFLRNTGKNYCICVSHGMLIRYMFHYYRGNRDIHPYDVINSRGFSFGHLDMMKVDTDRNEISLYRYKEPIRHRK